MAKHIPTEGAGKGDTPRPVNSKSWDEYFGRTGNDHCRLHHKHEESCKLKEEKIKCPRCNGKGSLLHRKGDKGTFNVCPNCQGKKRYFEVIPPVKEDQPVNGLHLISKTCKDCNLKPELKNCTACKGTGNHQIIDGYIFPPLKCLICHGLGKVEK